MKPPRIIDQTKLIKSKVMKDFLDREMPKVVMSDFKRIRQWRLINKVAERKLRGRGISSFRSLFDSGLTIKQLKKINGFNDDQIRNIKAVAKAINYKDFK